MKLNLTTFMVLGFFTVTTASGQQSFAQRVQANQAAQAAQAAASRFTAFDLDFPGGTPDELVEAIERATGKPLNAIIPTEHAHVQLPPLKMRNVTAPQLFVSLRDSSFRQIQYETGSYPRQPGGGSYKTMMTATTAYGFRRVGDSNDGDATIWIFFVEGAPNPPPEPKVCRYYQLGPYLESCSVDDITTAIQTGWRMLGEKDVPELSFHKETKLLIAVGDPGELGLIDDVLKQLSEDQKRTAPAEAAKAEESK